MVQITFNPDNSDQNNSTPDRSTELDTCQLESENVQSELAICDFNLKTLNDISRDIYGIVDTDTILKNFLLMFMGNLGLLGGFAMLVDENANNAVYFKSVGFEERDQEALRTGCRQCLGSGIGDDLRTGEPSSLNCASLTTFGIETVFSFTVQPGVEGILGLGSRLMSDIYSEKEKELLETLVNSLVVALKNAKSFESLVTLNRTLEEKNIALNNALENLRGEMKKVEILESVKENLSKFVPNAVSRAIVKSPSGRMPVSQDHDLSVLFLDIEGYTGLTEKLGGSEVNSIVEKHFSVFMDAIHANNGDVNETAGDGLMVLFLDEDRETNALNAVRTALTIQAETARIGEGIYTLYKPIKINIGIDSGIALVGAAKFDSSTGSRWTYTARGSLINVAARIGSMATGGQTLLSRATADRVADKVPLKKLGRFALKNVKDKIEVYELSLESRN